MKFGVRDVLSIEGHLFLINFLKSRTFHREKTLYIMEGGFRSMDLEGKRFKRWRLVKLTKLCYTEIIIY